jgi:hypothetical protein
MTAYPPEAPVVESKYSGAHYVIVDIYDGTVDCADPRRPGIMCGKWDALIPLTPSAKEALDISRRGG